MENFEFEHVSVLLSSVLDGLNIRPDGVYVDATMGGAGHSKAILDRLGPKGILIGIDQDATALQVGAERLSGRPCDPLDVALIARMEEADGG